MITGWAPSSRSIDSLSLLRVVAATSWPAASKLRHQPPSDCAGSAGEKDLHDLET